MLNYAGEAVEASDWNEAGSGYTASFVTVAIFRTPRDQTSKTGARGPKFSGHADIKGNYNVQNLGALDP